MRTADDSYIAASLCIAVGTDKKLLEAVLLLMGLHDIKKMVLATFT